VNYQQTKQEGIMKRAIAAALLAVSVTTAQADSLVDRMKSLGFTFYEPEDRNSGWNYGWFKTRMEMVPDEAVPAFCHEHHFFGFTEQEIKACTDAADAWQEQKSAEARAKAKPLTWKRVEADNGMIFAISVNCPACFSTENLARAVICPVDNGFCAIGSESLVTFDCHGHYQDTRFGSPVLIAPPRSVIGQMANIACAVPIPKEPENASKSQRDLSPADLAEYCKGLSPEACNRIKALAEAKTPPPTFCKPGFGVVGSGLTLEQIRVCEITGPVGSPRFGP
jgi:hypothetical protein